MSVVRNILDKAGCILEGKYFFVLKSGRVSNKYINIDPLLTDPIALRKICHALIDPFRSQFNCIVGPAVGGIPLVYTAAGIANDWIRHDKVWTAFADKDGDQFAFERMGFRKAVKGKNVLVVEDISTTGGSINATIEETKSAGGNVIGGSLIWKGGSLTEDDVNVPKLACLVEESVQTWNVNDGPPPGWGELPIVEDVGHPKKIPVTYQGGFIKLLGEAA